MKRLSAGASVLAVAALSVGFTMPASLTAVAAPPPPDTVVKWNEYAVNALIVTALQPPTGAAAPHAGRTRRGIPKGA